MSIAFHHEWRNAQGKLRAIPHLSTKNTSFLRMCQLLKKMGIKNCYFPLTLYDPDLEDVDVHALDENTPENENLRIKVQVESRRNVWYYLRECIRIYEQGGSPVRFQLNRNSCAMTWCFINGLDYTSMAPRQTGKAQPLDSLIKTPNGWVAMGDIKFNQLVSTPDGGVAKVTGIHPQGLQDTYQVILEDGRKSQSGVDHFWKIKHLNEEKILILSDILKLKEDVYFPVWENISNTKWVKVNFFNYVGKKECQCIAIDHPDRLYVTDDYMITHNTVAALSLTSWVLYSSGLEFQMGHMAKDNSLRQENVKRVKGFGESLPKWWIVEDKYRDKKNAEEIYYHQLKTHYVTFVAQSEKAAADKQARGASPPSFHFDEFEYSENIGISYPTILASTGTARQNAKKNGKPHSNILTTTAGDPTKAACREAMEILRGALPFTEQLYDTENLEKLHEIVEASSPQKMIIGIFSHLQLGRDNKWLKDIVVRNRMSPDQVMRDYLNRRVTISEKPVIPKNILNTITASEKDVTHTQIVSGRFIIYWYISEERRKSKAFLERPIVVGCDSSEMIGRDATTLVGVDPQTLETVFTFRCSEGNINVVGVMISHLLLMFPKMILVPENKSSGTAIIDNVSMILRREGHNPFTRMFNWVVQNRQEEEFRKINIRDVNLLDTSIKRYFGIKTDKSKRDQLYSSVLMEACTKAAAKIKDKSLIQELTSLTEKNGRVDHESGGNDDLVIAWLLCFWFILHGKNLDIYGIKPGTILSHFDPTNPDKSQMNQVHIEKIQAKQKELEQKLKYEKDPQLRKMLESDLEIVKSMIPKGGAILPETADELLRNPEKFIDRDVAEQSRSPISMEDIKNTLTKILPF